MSEVKWPHSATKGKVGMITLVDSSVKAAIRIVLYFQICGVGIIMVFLIVKYIRGLLNSYLICINREVLSQVNKCLIWIIKTVMNPQSIPKLSQVIDPKPFEGSGGCFPLRKEPHIVPKFYNWSFSLLQSDRQPVEVGTEWHILAKYVIAGYISVLIRWN